MRYLHCINGRAQRIVLIGLITLLPLAATVPAAESERIALEDFPQSRLRIRTQTDDLHRFRVYVARTQRQKIQGLMYVRELPPDTGMLFIYDPPRPASMWMKNTYISLDMLFIRADGTIANIARETVPHTLDSHRSEGPVAAVLELAGGSAGYLGIEPGDRVLIDEVVH